MKIIITAFLLLAVALSGISQIKDSTKIKEQENYLRKSKNSKTIGLIMLGGGAVLAITGAVLLDEGWGSGSSYEKEDIGGVMFIVGGLSVLGSVFPLIQSGIYKKKAMKLTAGIDLESAMPVGAYKTSYYPALSVKLSLK